MPPGSHRPRIRETTLMSSSRGSRGATGPAGNHAVYLVLFLRARASLLLRSARRNVAASNMKFNIEHFLPSSFYCAPR